MGVISGLAAAFAALDATVRWLLIGGAASFLALVVLVIVLLCRRGRKTPETVEDEPAMLFANVHNVGKRPNQQDSFGISNLADAALCSARGVMMMVADGMGGLADGAEMSAIVQSTFMQGFSLAHQLPDDPSVALAMLANTANNRIVNRLSESEGGAGGSTVVAAVVRSGWLYWVSVGDSRISLLRGGGLIPLNREQTYGVETDDKVAAGTLSWGEAMAEKQRAALTSYLGSREMTYERSVLPIKLMRGDRVLLMSDGVFGTLSDDALVACMTGDVYASASSLEAAVLAADRPGQDNLTAIIFDYN